MCVCFLHKILHTRRFYKTLPWNNVLYAARRPIARKIHREYILVGNPLPVPTSRVHSVEFLRDRYFQCAPPPSAIHLPLISFILFCDLATRPTHIRYRERMQRERLHSTLSTATLRNNVYWSTVYCHTLDFFESKRYEYTLRADIVGSRLMYKINVGKIQERQPETLGCPFDSGMLKGSRDSQNSTMRSHLARTRVHGATRVTKGDDLYRIERRSRKSYTRHFTSHIIFFFCKKFYSLSLSLSLFSYIALLHLVLFIPFSLSFSFALKI